VEGALELAIQNNELSLLMVAALFKSAWFKGFLGEDGQYSVSTVSV